jgi:hypothetical protein
MVFHCFWREGFIGKAVLNVFPQDVDVVNRWFVCTSLLGGCLALMGARDNASSITGGLRRWTVHFLVAVLQK